MDDGKGNELKRTQMEKVLDRKEIIGKGNQLFLEEYFSFDGMLQPHDNQFCCTAVAQSFKKHKQQMMFLRPK